SHSARGSSSGCPPGRQSHGSLSGAPRRRAPVSREKAHRQGIGRNARQRRGSLGPARPRAKLLAATDQSAKAAVGVGSDKRRGRTVIEHVINDYEKAFGALYCTTVFPIRPSGF